MNRRQFLQTLGVAGLSSSVLAAVPPETVAVKPPDDRDDSVVLVLRFGDNKPIIVTGKPPDFFTLSLQRVPAFHGRVTAEFHELLGRRETITSVCEDYDASIKVNPPLRISLKHGHIEQPLLTLERPVLLSIDGLYSSVRTGDQEYSVCQGVPDYVKPSDFVWVRNLQLFGIWTEYVSMCRSANIVGSPPVFDEIRFPAAKDMWCTTGDQQ